MEQQSTQCCNQQVHWYGEAALLGFFVLLTGIVLGVFYRTKK